MAVQGDVGCGVAGEEDYAGGGTESKRPGKGGGTGDDPGGVDVVKGVVGGVNLRFLPRNGYAVAAYVRGGGDEAKVGYRGDTVVAKLAREEGGSFGSGVEVYEAFQEEVGVGALDFG